jgi:hypothetical protein
MLHFYPDGDLKVTVISESLLEGIKPHGSNNWCMRGAIGHAEILLKSGSGWNITIGSDY